MNLTGTFGRIIGSPYLLWLVLAIPSFTLIPDFWHFNRYYPELMHESGVFSVQLLVASLLVTPAIQVLKHLPFGIPVSRWLLKSRRHIGVACFCYAVLHLAFYTREQWDAVLIFLEALDVEFATGWLAMLVFAALAITSTDRMVRRLGTGWKKLHMLVYPATALTFIHWLLFDDFTSHAIAWLVPLLVLRLAHLVWITYRNGKSTKSLAA